MNWAHAHLILNHVPVLGTIFGLALLAWAVLRRNETLQRAAFGTFALVAVAAIPTFLTGEPSEEMVEHLAGTAEAAIKTHEDAAVVALIAALGLGVLALGTLLLFRKRGIPRPLAGGTLVFALATAGWMTQTANLGGRIRHAEVRATATQTQDHLEDHATREREGR
ncbi:MAG TPA: hypothetical protein VJ755_13140 [Gemmatimonadales bacterium]|nr:hypothetical protein [Gemmatimonadales bacterium]